VKSAAALYCFGVLGGWGLEVKHWREGGGATFTLYYTSLIASVVVVEHITYPFISYFSALAMDFPVPLILCN